MKRQGGVTNKQGGQNRKRMTVNLRHLAIPDAEQRLSRATGILLKAAARKSTQQPKAEPNTQKEKPPAQAPTEGALTSGDGNHSHDEG